MLINGNKSTESEVYDFIATHLSKDKSIPVNINSHSTTLFTNVATLLNICASGGTDRVTFSLPAEPEGVQHPYIYRLTEERWNPFDTDATESTVITVTPTSFRYLNKSWELSDINSYLSRTARLSTNIVILIKCTPDAQYGNLVEILDSCQSNGFSRIFVFSM